jgi:hypothetical protein
VPGTLTLAPVNRCFRNTALSFLATEPLVAREGPKRRTTHVPRTRRRRFPSAMIGVCRHTFLGKAGGTPGRASPTVLSAVNPPGRTVFTKPYCSFLFDATCPPLCPLPDRQGHSIQPIFFNFHTSLLTGSFPSERSARPERERMDAAEIHRRNSVFVSATGRSPP